MYPILKALSLPVQRCFIKYGYRARLTEAATNEFIAKYTTIPVPRILDVFKRDGTVHIVQEFIDAPLLMKVWHKLGLDDRKRCMIQLKGYIEQLRSLVPPEPGKVQAIDGGGFTDNRLGHDEWGPFESHDTFNDFFHHETVRKLSSRYPRAQAPLAVTKGRTWRTVFAHGDLGPHNILWDTNRREIAAIIDWEFSGWFPEYWEYTRVYFGPATFWTNDYGWWEMFQEYNECYPEELDVEIILSDYFTLNL
jgi:serine/threonine protein kinase